MGDNTEAGKLLCDEAQRMLVRQEAVLDTLRTQAVALLSVASLVAGLFASRLIPGSHSLRVVVASWIAVALFGGTAVLTIVILLPRGWDFSHDLKKPLDQVSRRNVLTPLNVTITWAEMYEKMRHKNQKPLDDLMCGFWWACVLAGAQVVAWAVAAI